MRHLIAVLIFLSGCLWAAASYSDGPEIREWEVPYSYSRPRDPGVDSKGRVWFCGQTGAYLAYLEPESGNFRKYDMPDDARPHNLIIDADDRIWFAANTLPYIGRLNPNDGTFKKFPMPEGTAEDPHTLVFGENGTIWFTAQWSNHIGRLNTETGKVEAIRIPESGSRPYGIKMDPSGNPWIVLFGTNKLARINATSLELTIVELPDTGTRPRRLEISSDGIIWYGDYTRGKLGSYNPAQGSFAEWPLPGGSRSKPYGMAQDQFGHLWLAEAGNPNRLVEFDPDKAKFDAIVDAPNAQGAIRHMYFHEQDNTIWFGEDSNFVGRLKVN